MLETDECFVSAAHRDVKTTESSSNHVWLQGGLITASTLHDKMKFKYKHMHISMWLIIVNGTVVERLPIVANWDNTQNNNNNTVQLEYCNNTNK